MKEFQAAASRGEIESNMGTIVMASSPIDAAIKAFSMNIDRSIVYIRNGEEIQRWRNKTTGTPKLTETEND
jgi:hypothetical protein